MADEPVFTLPKPIFVVLKVSVCVAVTPVPDKEMAVGELGALLTIVTLPVAEPADDGANWTLKLLDWPAARLMGNASVFVLKPLPATLTCEMVKVPLPLFES